MEDVMQTKKKKQNETESIPPVYSDSRRTNGGRGRVEIAIWENQTEYGTRFGTQLKYVYRNREGDWVTIDNPMADQWLETAKILDDADSWRQQRLREQRAERANATAHAEDILPENGLEEPAF
jgi:hypothetical protein